MSDLRARLEATSSSAVEDARGKRGALPARIQRRAGSGVVAGPAITARCEEGSVNGVLRALSEARAGEILVAQGAGDCGYFGELTGAEAVRRGVAAIVVDGMVRDVEKLGTLPLHVYASGQTPHGGLPEGGGEAGVPLSLGAVEVRPGDWLVCDADGCTLIPAEDVEQVAARAEEITAGETAAWENIVGGKSFFDQALPGGKTLRERVFGA